MRLLKAHSHSSDGQAMNLGKREEKRLKGTKNPQQGKPPSRTCRELPMWRGREDRKGSTANKPQKRQYDEAHLFRKEGEHTH